MMLRYFGGCHRLCHFTHALFLLLSLSFLLIVLVFFLPSLSPIDTAFRFGYGSSLQKCSSRISNDFIFSQCPFAFANSKYFYRSGILSKIWKHMASSSHRISNGTLHLIFVLRPKTSPFISVRMQQVESILG